MRTTLRWLIGWTFTTHHGLHGEPYVWSPLQPAPWSLVRVLVGRAEFAAPDA